MTCPMVAKKVITHFPMENSDPVTIAQRYHLRIKILPLASNISTLNSTLLVAREHHSQPNIRYTGTLPPNIPTLIETDGWWLTSWHVCSLQWTSCHQSLNINNDGNSYHYGNYTNTNPGHNLWHNSKYKCWCQQIHWGHSRFKNYVKTAAEC